MKAVRTGIVIKPDYKRVFYRALTISPEERIIRIINRILALSDEEVENEIGQVLNNYEERHLKLKDFYLGRFNMVKKYVAPEKVLSSDKKLLIGAYFTMEYSLESAALFNPSMIWHPDQSDLPEGSRRFILSLRATGEGHISSITFRTGVIDEENNITVDNPTRYVSASDNITNPAIGKTLFRDRLRDHNLYNDFSEQVLKDLDNSFTAADLENSAKKILDTIKNKNEEHEITVKEIIALALSDYEIRYDRNQKLSERIIFPHSPAESNGIEDARFVEFTEDDGQRIYYATYTAYNGKTISPQLLVTKDFLHFKITTLTGSEVRNKGMALFPRKVNGQYAMISRQDNENIYLMYSGNLKSWDKKQIILKPEYPWELVQLGNCGSPIETEAGWLVLSHAVGAMREYSMGAFLLDKDDPSKVIGRLKEPLLNPDETEREGYVPNVVYSCGSVMNRDELIIPYAMSDYASSIAKVSVSELINKLKEN